MREVNPLFDDESRVKENKKKEKNIRTQEIEDMRFLLSRPEARRLFWRYLELTGVFANSFDGTFRTYFNEGKRVIGTTLLTEITDANPLALGELMKEQLNKEEK